MHINMFDSFHFTYLKKNRLYIVFDSDVKKKDVEQIYTDVRFGVADLKPGFDVITDLSACSLGALSGLPTFRKITNHLINNKVGRVVRVIDETKIIKKQLFNITARSQSYKADIYSSMEAAEEYLTNSDDSPELRFTLNDQGVEYVFEGTNGSGSVEFLSICECKVVASTLSLAIGSKATLTIKFDTYEELLDLFEVSVEVTSVEGDGFGTKFIDVDDEIKDRLWKRLVHESQKEFL